MRCNKVKNLIGDYIDGELKDQLKKRVENHIKTCPSCREYELALKNVVISPLEKSKLTKAPDHLWSRIKESILDNERKPKVRFIFLEHLASLRLGKPALALTSVALILIVITSLVVKNVINKNMIFDSYMIEQVEHISSLAQNGEESLFGVESVDLGTSIEKYFL